MEANLRSSGPFTLFLPTDEAVEKLGSHYIHALRYDSEGMKAFVLNHIVNGVHCLAVLHDAKVRSQQLELNTVRCRSSGTFVKGKGICSFFRKQQLDQKFMKITRQAARWCANNKRKENVRRCDFPI